MGVRAPRLRRTRITIAAALVMTGGICSPALAEGPRIVSLNLCTDQLLLSVADPDQVLGLSPFAADRSQSVLAAEAVRFPKLSGTAEEVLVLRPDVVVTGRYVKRATRDLLKARGVSVVAFDTVTTVAQARDQIGQIGALTGHIDRAEKRIAAIDAALDRARIAAARVPLRVLPLERRGWVSGRDTLTTALLDVVGLRNAGAAFSPDGGQVGLETIVALKPDLLLVSQTSERAEDQGSALLRHPALRGLYPPTRRLVLPERLILCGGPEIATALDWLTAEIAKLR